METGLLASATFERRKDFEPCDSPHASMVSDGSASSLQIPEVSHPNEQESVDNKTPRSTTDKPLALIERTTSDAVTSAAPKPKQDPSSNLFAARGTLSASDMLLLLSPGVASSVKFAAAGPYACRQCARRFPTLNALGVHEKAFHNPHAKKDGETTTTEDDKAPSPTAKPRQKKSDVKADVLSADGKKIVGRKTGASRPRGEKVVITSSTIMGSLSAASVPVATTDSTKDNSKAEKKRERKRSQKGMSALEAWDADATAAASEGKRKVPHLAIELPGDDCRRATGSVSPPALTPLSSRHPTPPLTVPGEGSVAPTPRHGGWMHAGAAPADVPISRADSGVAIPLEAAGMPLPALVPVNAHGERRGESAFPPSGATSEVTRDERVGEGRFDEGAKTVQEKQQREGAGSPWLQALQEQLHSDSLTPEQMQLGEQALLLLSLKHEAPEKGDKGKGRKREGKRNKGGKEEKGEDSAASVAHQLLHMPYQQQQQKQQQEKELKPTVVRPQAVRAFPLVLPQHGNTPTPLMTLPSSLPAATSVPHPFSLPPSQSLSGVKRGHEASAPLTLVSLPTATHSFLPLHAQSEQSKRVKVEAVAEGHAAAGTAAMAAMAGSVPTTTVTAQHHVPLEWLQHWQQQQQQQQQANPQQLLSNSQGQKIMVPAAPLTATQQLFPLQQQQQVTVATPTQYATTFTNVAYHKPTVASSPHANTPAAGAATTTQPLGFLVPHYPPPPATATTTAPPPSATALAAAPAAATNTATAVARSPAGASLAGQQQQQQQQQPPLQNFQEVFAQQKNLPQNLPAVLANAAPKDMVHVVAVLKGLSQLAELAKSARNRSQGGGGGRPQLPAEMIQAASHQAASMQAAGLRSTGLSPALMGREGMNVGEGGSGGVRGMAPPILDLDLHL